jgi:hypothetical protein
MKTPGQILYEILGRNAKARPEWHAWCELSETLQALYERDATDFLRELGASRCGLTVEDLKALETHRDKLWRQRMSAAGAAGF